MALQTEITHTNLTCSLVAENLSKKFNAEWIFRNLNYSFQSGNTYAITGPNGSGKSTLLQIIWGQVPPTSGIISYKLFDKPIEPDLIYNHISIATPYMDLVDEFSLKEQVEFHFKLKPILPGYSIAHVIHDMYLDDAADKSIGNFSSGMKQRLKLGLAFFTDVPAIFLDEPGTNLDEKAFDWYRTLLANCSLNRLILIASNNRDEYPADARVISLTDFK